MINRARLSAILLVSIFLIACGGGGGGTPANSGTSGGTNTGGTNTGGTNTGGSSSGGTTSVPTVTLGSSKGQILLGPIVGATVYVYSIDDRLSGVDSAPICSAITSDLASGEPGVVDLSNCNIDESSLYFVWARNGLDIDADDDGELDAVPTAMRGDVRAVLTGEQIRQGDWRANILTEMGYQAIEPLMLSEERRENLLNVLNGLSTRLIRADMNNDGIIDRQDLSAFVPNQHQDRLQSRDSEFLDSMLEAILSGNRNRVNYFARSYLLSAIGEFNLSGLTGAYFAESGPAGGFLAGDMIISNNLLYSHSPMYNDNSERLPDIRLGIFDVSDLSNAQALGFLTIEDFIDYDAFGADIQIVLQGTLLFISSGTHGLAIVDVSDPASPELLSKYPVVEFTVSKIHIRDSIAYLYEPDNTGTLLILDVSDPSDPVELNQFDSFDILGIAAYDDQTLLISASSGLRIYDSSNPAQPALAEQTDLSFSQFKFSEGYLYVLEDNEGAEGIRIYNATDLQNIEPLGWVPSAGLIEEFKLSGDLLYLKNEGIVSTYSIEDRSNPYVVDVRSVPDGAQLTLDNGRLYLSSGSNVIIYPVDALNEPPENLAILPTTGAARHIGLRGNVAFLSVGGDLVAVDVSDPTSGMEELDRVEVGEAEDILILGNYVLVASEGLIVVDASNPANMTRVFSDILGLAELPEGRYWDTAGVAVSGNYAYLATRDGDQSPQFVVFDLSDIESPAFLTRMPTDCTTEITINRGTLYCGLSYYDISDPESPVFIDDIAEEDRRFINITIDSDTLYKTGGTAGLSIYNVSSPSTIVRQGEAQGLGAGNEIAVQGNLAYVANEFGFIDIYDVTDKYDPIFISQLKFSGSVKSLAVDENYIYAANIFGLIVEPAVELPSNLPQ